jgi:GTPase SAR1 family protein
MVFSTGMILIGSWVADKIAEKGFDSLHSKLTSTNELNDSFYEAVGVVSAKLQKKYPKVLGGSIDYFFKKEEIFEEFLKLLFVNSSQNYQDLSLFVDLTTLPDGFIEEFVSNLTKELHKYPLIHEILSNKEVFLVLQGLGKDVETITKSTTLSTEEITRIRSLLEQRIGGLFSFERFFKTYSANTLNNLSQVNFLGLGVDITIKRKRKKLQDIFIAPNFNLTFESIVQSIDSVWPDVIKEIVEIKYHDLFNQSDRLVILGNPGSGKSVLVKSIICSILENRQLAFSNNKILLTIPFRIELRKYLAFKKTNHSNILRYLSVLLEEEYGIENITEPILNDILSNKECFLFFDGLDEIFRVEDKVAVKNDIENFHSTYSTIKSITTSRIIGYEEAKLDDRRFTELQIQNFDDAQIEEYLKKWYDQEEEHEEIRKKEVEDFLEKRRNIDDELLSNPLLLSLIVILYRNTLKLPDSKLEIYQSCTKTLVDKWDASKELVIDLEPIVYKSKEKIFANLAYWQYEELSSEIASITYEKAKSYVALTLREKIKLPEHYDSEDIAEQFMLYAQKRSIYFDNNFTHKTFLEYYTAYWIYSNIEKKHLVQKRNELISKYIDNSFWHIVLELLFNMIDKDQGDSEIMDSVISEQLKSQESLPFILSTIVRFKNISEKLVESVITASLEALLNKQNRIELSNREYLDIQIFHGVERLFSSHKKLKDLIFEYLVRALSDDSPIMRKASCYNLYFDLEVVHPDFDLFNQIEIFQTEQFNEIRKHDINLFFYSTNLYEEKFGLENLMEAIEFFGPVLVCSDISSYYNEWSTSPFVMRYLNEEIESGDLPSLERNLDKIELRGLFRKDIINFLVEETNFGFIFNFDKKSAIKVLGLIYLSRNRLTAIILLVILFKSLDMAFVLNFGPKDLKKLVKGNKYEKTFNEIISIASFKDKFAYINTKFELLN